MFNIFYIFPLLFMWTEYYQFKNFVKLYEESHKDELTKVDFLFYLTRCLYLMWMFIGLCSSARYYALIIILLGLFKIFLMTSNLRKAYEITSFSLTMLILLYMFIDHFFL